MNHNGLLTGKDGCSLPLYESQNDSMTLKLTMTITFANPATLASLRCQLPPKLAVYNSSVVSSNPEILVVDDYHYCKCLALPSAPLAPTIIDIHPVVDIVLTHVGHKFQITC